MIATQIEPTATLAQLQESKPERVTIVLLSGDLDRAMALFEDCDGSLTDEVKSCPPRRSKSYGLD